MPRVTWQELVPDAESLTGLDYQECVDLAMTTQFWRRYAIVLAEQRKECLDLIEGLKEGAAERIADLESRLEEGK